MQQQQYEQEENEMESELSDYPGGGEEDEESELLGEDLGETGQLSPTQSSPDRQLGNLGNFMQEA
jgi:hypothetical protein